MARHSKEAKWRPISFGNGCQAIEIASVLFGRFFSKCALKSLDNQADLIPPFPGSNPGAPASKSLFLHEFLFLYKMPAGHGACGARDRVSVSQNRRRGPDFGRCLCGPISVSRFHKRGGGSDTAERAI
jgi:hypothetical protein